MKIAIHHRKGSFSEHWITYCKEKGIDFEIVNAYDTNIITQLDNYDAFMWHHHHADYRDVLFAKQLLYSLIIKGLKVFPDYNTTWHFDDKVGQKYLLEAIGAPLVSSFVFYNKKEAVEWVKQTTFPKVFKLSGGAGSANVKMVNSKRQAFSIIRKAFGNGFKQFDKFGYLKERYREYKTGKVTIFGLIKGGCRFLFPTEYSKMHAPEKGYVYFQDFIPDNKYDVRIIVIGGKRAYGMNRIVRKGDFRASGSGEFIYERIDERILSIAFNVAHKLKLQSVAFDFIYTQEGDPLIVELSYGFGTKGSGKCSGYWDRNLNWYEGKFNSQDWIVEDLINS